MQLPSTYNPGTQIELSESREVRHPQTAQRGNFVVVSISPSLLKYSF